MQKADTGDFWSFVVGEVRRYNGKGRGLGYPTANVAAVIDLRDGIYFGYADLARYRQRPALVFVGAPVTVGDEERRVEAHLLDINDEDYYGQQLRLRIEHFHRSNVQFASVDELTVAIRTDEAAARKWFATQKFNEETEDA